MQIATVHFAESSEKDLVDIVLFHIYKQEMPQEIAIIINDSIVNKTSFVLSTFPSAGAV